MARRSKLHGVKELRAAINRANPELRQEALEEVEKSTRKMYQDARSRLASASSYAEFWHGQQGMQNITGAFRRFYRMSISKKNLRGRVGLLSSTAVRRAPQVRWFNDGTVNQPARPFHDDAFEAERDPYIAAQTAALQRVLTKLFR